MPSHPIPHPSTPPHQRARAILSGVAWFIPIALLILHVLHVPWLSSDLWTLLGVVWFGTAGYLGAPVYALSLSTGRISTRTCSWVSSALFGISALLSFLFALHDLTPTPTNEALALIVPIALGAQAHKTAAAHTERERAVADAISEYDIEHHANPCPACNLRAQIDQQHERLRKLSCLDKLDGPEKDDAIDAIAEALADGRGNTLHVIDGRSSVRHTH